MRERFDHAAIDKAARAKWAEQRLYQANEASGKPKRFVLDMFPYPSGDGLHVGHPKGYIATDIYSRFMRMKGHEVLHPMGWDAFGLPAENYAIKNKVHPRVAVERNIARFKDQLERIGFDYDWSREINTTDPEYYRWTQWIFLKLLERGLAYESEEPINWCPSCMTGLANEDVESDGTCERCGSVVEKRPMRQWVLKITDYADRLLEDLETLSAWPPHIKEQQRAWIGRKEGIVVSHAIEGTELSVDTFSAYPAWMFADTFLVLAPEHPLVPKLVKGRPEEKEVAAFVKRMAAKSLIERAEGKEKEGAFTGCYALDPYRPGTKMPIYVANFALMGFGTGAIRCSSHDERDVAFAQRYGIPLRAVVGDGTAFVNVHENAGTLVDSGPFTDREISPELIQEMVEWMVKEGIAKRKVSYKIQDWVFSRQRYWGEPIPVIHCEKDGVVPVPYEELPVTLPEVEQYEPTGTGESPLAAIEEWVNVACPRCKGPAKRETNTMPQWAGSSWYYLRFMDPKNEAALVAEAKEKFWAPVDVYVGGDHAVRHLIYARFWHKFLFDIGIVSTNEPFARLEFLGFILAEDGRKMSKRWGNVINPDDVIAEHGADAFRVYEMFMGPFENTTAWSTASIAGTARFIDRVWNAAALVRDEPVEALSRVLNESARKVAEDIEAFKFNTAVSQLMILMNAVEKEKAIGRHEWSVLLRLLAPFAPHVTEALWEKSGNEGSIHAAPWPSFDPAALVSATVPLVVQVAGKRRGEASLPADASEEEATAAALLIPAVKAALPKGAPSRVVYVPGRVINLLP